jgi:ribosomal protein S1
LASFGAFARVKGGLEGLIHLSELSYDKIDVPSDVVREGQEVEVKIIKIEEERKRLGLSLLLDKEINEPAFESSESEQTNNSSEESSEESPEQKTEESSEESPEQKTEESPEENTEENTEESSEESSEEKN